MSSSPPFSCSRGHDAVHVRELAIQRAADRRLTEKARADDRIVLTFDLDFGEILALGVVDRPSVVIFRLADERADSEHVYESYRGEGRSAYTEAA